MLLSSIGCQSSDKKNAYAEGDILTQTIPQKDKIPVTILVKNAFSINAYEKAVEKEFSNIDIIQVANYTSDMGVDEFEARLKHDDLTDIVMTWPLRVGEEYWEDRLLDLSSLPLTSNYNHARLDNISKDGNLYFLPGPSQLRGIVYNKTLFQENGWEVPTNFEGFIALCKEIEESGIRSFQLGLKNAEVLDTAFVGFGYNSSFSKPKDTQWLNNYNHGKGSFSDQYMEALDTFQRLIDEQILKKEDLDIAYQDREKMFFNRETAMTEDSVLLARMGRDYNGNTDEFALMPFFNPGTNADWARLYPVCYIGLNKHLAESEQKEKYDLILQLLEYTSTVEGQEALMGDTGAMISALNNVAPPDIVEIEDMMDTLTVGRSAIFPTLKNAQDALRQGLAGMVDGTMDKYDVIKAVDERNAAPAIKAAPQAIGTATKDFTIMETGNYITDVMREEAKTDIALFLDNGKDGKYNGKGVSARLYQGDISTVDIKRILPDVKSGEKIELWKITMTGRDLLKTLESSISVQNDKSGWFYYFSGLEMEYDVTEKAGKRIKKITTDKGKKIELDKLYTIAVMDESVPNEFIKSKEETGKLIADLLTSSIRESKRISPSEDGRFTIPE